MSEEKKKIPEAEISDEELDTVTGGAQTIQIPTAKYTWGDETPTFVPPPENVANVTPNTSSKFF